METNDNIIDTINVEFDKRNMVARPRSTDKYYECAIVLKKTNKTDINRYY